MAHPDSASRSAIPDAQDRLPESRPPASLASSAQIESPHRRAPAGISPGRQYAGSVATREELKAEVERIGRDHGHTLGIWLDLGHASQLGCLGCDRYAFVQVLPPPGQAFTEAFEQPCPDRGQRLIETPE
jgi:hypothetical protein